MGKNATFIPRASVVSEGVTRSTYLSVVKDERVETKPHKIVDATCCSISVTWNETQAESKKERRKKITTREKKTSTE
jgi:4-hydroxy-3-methylbut-2-enyl diphosphate reductase IspH